MTSAVFWARSSAAATCSSARTEAALRLVIPQLAQAAPDVIGGVGALPDVQAELVFGVPFGHAGQPAGQGAHARALQKGVALQNLDILLDGDAMRHGWVLSAFSYRIGGR